ncbi:hypothetical protein [Phormidium sp. CCY1219]|uniref:hypothetical protein n=1 Tax=Phormidium sp. CCY1219 TaxID=2886104 RepID=UPI002D1F14C4|nr:hypothetical protein [Phormidium sp. CCY1219]MEB3831041.1 hypothetical protein [Phormidium sp. CCY1219]
MSEYSPSIRLAWKMAAGEARLTHATEIEPAHLLIGICKLCDADLAQVLAGKVLSERQKNLVKDEVEFLRKQCGEAGMDLQRLRRRLRGVVMQPKPPVIPRRFPRSHTTKQVFSWAETIATAQGDYLQLPHLLQGLLELPSPPWMAIFAEMGIENCREQLFPTGLNYHESKAVTQMVESVEEVVENDLLPTETMRLVQGAIAHNPSLRNPAVMQKAIARNARLRNMLKAGGIELIKLIFPPLGIPIAMILAWLEDSAE